MKRKVMLPQDVLMNNTAEIGGGSQRYFSTVGVSPKAMRQNKLSKDENQHQRATSKERQMYEADEDGQVMVPLATNDDLLDEVG